MGAHPSSTRLLLSLLTIVWVSVEARAAPLEGKEGSEGSPPAADTPAGHATASGSTLETQSESPPVEASTQEGEKNQTASPAGPKPPTGAVGLRTATPNYTPEELRELEELGETVKRFEREALEYREATRQLIEYKYKQKRDRLYNSYERLIQDLEKDQRVRRDAAIAKFEAFVRRYPEDPLYSPDAMFRLSELYFERSYDTYFQARQRFDKAMEHWDPDSGAPEPTEPSFHYEPTIAMMQRLIVEFPDYRLVDGAYYLLGYCLSEQGEEERAVDVYEELVARRPDSRFAPEVWTRIGEHYFNSNQLERALYAYNQVLGHVESPFYDKAIYKLAWTHYRLADPERTPEEFQSAVDTFVALLDFNEASKKEGKERGGDLRKESIQYIAISYAEEGWGSSDKMVAYFDAKGEQPYSREVFVALGDVYFDQTRYPDAVRMYQLVQERYPLHAEAPDVQEKIITAHERDRDFQAASQERDRLTSLYIEGTEWHNSNQDDEAALLNARRLTEKSLYTAALFHHKQAQIHKEAEKLDLAKQEYELAADAYAKYLERFPHDKQLYELTFYLAECYYYSLQFHQAAVHYTKVREATADDKFLEDAALSTILAYENAIKVEESRGGLQEVAPVKSSERDPEATIEAGEIPELRMKFVQASDRYAELIPHSAETPKIMYKAAEVFYNFDHFEEARRRFGIILERFPDSEVAQYASNLTIESYLAQQDYAAVEKFTRDMLEQPTISGRRELKQELVKFRSGAKFKIADQLAEKGEHEEAAKLYVELIDEDPESEFADLALNNAAVQYEKVSRFDSASRLYERLVKDYPKSTMADTALFRVALNAERFFDFNKAIGTYLNLVDEYPNSERRADATFNAALSLENTQQYEEAAQQYLRYCKLFPKREDAPAVCFRAGTVYEKMKDPQRVISTYREFVKKYRNNSEHSDRIVEAHIRIAKAYAELGKPRDVKQAYEAAVKEYKRNPTEKSAPYAAEAQFALVETRFKTFLAIKFTGPAKKQQKTLLKKAELLKEIEEEYKAILVFKQIDWTLASLYRIGQLYHEFARSLIDAECPPDVKAAARKVGATVDEVCDEYRFLLEDRAVNLEDKAVEAYETTITRARELQVANPWTKKTLVQLNKLRRKLWPLQKDAKFYIDDVAVEAPGLRGDDGKLYQAAPAAETSTPEGGDAHVPHDAGGADNAAEAAPEGGAVPLQGSAAPQGGAQPVPGAGGPAEGAPPAEPGSAGAGAAPGTPPEGAPPIDPDPAPPHSAQPLPQP